MDTPNALLSASKRHALAVLITALLGASATHAQSLASCEQQREITREVVEFKLAHPIAEADQAVFVVGTLPELGASDRLRSVQLVSADGRLWRVSISLPLDRSYSYRYLRRSTRVEDLGDPANATPLSPELRAKTGKSASGPGTKAFQVHTSLVDPVLHWRQDTVKYALAPLELVGTGRTPPEQRFGQRAFAVGGHTLEFFLTSWDGGARDPADAATTYVTPLDEFFLQDGEIFSYVPAPVVSPMRLASATPLTIQSSVLGRARKYRVMLPRGYDEHVARRYPVLYLYDGQTAWSPGPFSGQFGVWDRSGTRMARLVASGEVGEVIQVAIDYVEEDPFCDAGISRARDCLSPEDTISELPGCGRVTGMADLFVRFLVEELKPFIDATYRTLPDREHTFATGYSLGGVFAMYAGWEFTNTFSAIAAQSGSFWVPNFTARVLLEERADLRVYLDMGDLEVPDITGPAARLRENFLLLKNRVLERDLRFSIGFGDDHAFRSGGRRMRSLMTFLWPATCESAQVPWPW